MHLRTAQVRINLVYEWPKCFTHHGRRAGGEGGDVVVSG